MPRSGAGGRSVAIARRLLLGFQLNPFTGKPKRMTLMSQSPEGSKWFSNHESAGMFCINPIMSQSPEGSKWFSYMMIFTNWSYTFSRRNRPKALSGFPTSCLTRTSTLCPRSRNRPKALRDFPTFLSTPTEPRKWVCVSQSPEGSY